MKPTWQQQRTAWRQQRYPPEWRIAEAVWPAASWERFEQLATALKQPQPPPVIETLDARLLADLCTQLWRLRTRMLDKDRPREEMRRVYRYVEAAWDALASAGIEILDHTGEMVPEGGVYALKIIAVEPHPELAREMVIETVKPSVYRAKHLVQMGEVIVGRPDGKS